MPKYYNKDTFDVLEIPEELYAQWIEDQNPKAEAFILLPPEPVYNPDLEYPPQFVRGEWSRTYKTQEEVKEQEDRTKVLNVMDAMANSEGTAGERIKRLESALVFLLKFLMKRFG